ncbi:hypothetical protein ETAE_3155 [Edwardsiella piscicida]|uniref:Uncharacterized protein n=1 Tax=Edwardsiella piscicida TaxID=1263550 RepID=A0AAU8P5Q4_EDWPI|nr:hypothetical protein ETAE_3155 [Edwardsiella tarda EIB202]
MQKFMTTAGGGGSVYPPRRAVSVKQGQGEKYLFAKKGRWGRRVGVGSRYCAGGGRSPVGLQRSI